MYIIIFEIDMALSIVEMEHFGKASLNSPTKFTVATNGMHRLMECLAWNSESPSCSVGFKK